ncbi:hypothetical protein L195_g028934, partial [Trifolium pratense]
MNFVMNVQGVLLRIKLAAPDASLLAVFCSMVILWHMTRTMVPTQIYNHLLRGKGTYQEIQ